MPLFIAFAGYVDEGITTPTEMPELSGKCFRPRELSWMTDEDKEPNHISYYDSTDLLALEHRGKTKAIHDDRTGLPVNPIKGHYIDAPHEAHESTCFLSDIAKLIAAPRIVVFAGAFPCYIRSPSINATQKGFTMPTDFGATCGFHDNSHDASCTKNKVLSLKNWWRKAEKTRHRTRRRTQRNSRKQRSRSPPSSRESPPQRQRSRSREKTPPPRYVPGEQVSQESRCPSLSNEKVLPMPDG